MLGSNISGTPLTNVAVNPFASALAGLLFSKGLNYIKEVSTQLLTEMEGIVTEAAKQIPASKPQPQKLIKNLLPVCFEVSQELIGEFTGKNIVYRVLPDGKIETTNQGTGKIMGVSAIIMSTAIGSVENGSYVAEINSLISTVMDETGMLKGNSVSGQSEKGILRSAATYQITKAEKFARLNKMLLLHEYVTDMEGNWKGKIWEWK